MTNHMKAASSFVLTVALVAQSLCAQPAPFQFPRSLDSFAPPANTSAAPRAIAIGDINGDLVPDMVVAASPSFILLQGAQIGSSLFEGHGVFHDITAAQPPFPGGLGSFSQLGQAVALGDLDSDGDLDLVFGTSTSGIQVVVGINSGAGIFAFTPIAAAPRDTSDIKLGDVDGDGDLDILVASRNMGTGTPSTTSAGLQLFVNIGAGVFQDVTAASGVAVSVSAIEVDLFDDDGDGDLDIFVAGFQIQVGGALTPSFLLHNNGAGFFSNVTTVSFPLGVNTSVDTGDVDGNGLTDIVIGSNTTGPLVCTKLQNGQFLVSPLPGGLVPNAINLTHEVGDLP